jgi:hypothetical protein
MRIGVTSLLFCSLFSFTCLAQNSSSKSSNIIIDSVIKIKEDDDGKLILLNQNKKVLYLKNDQKNYDNILIEVSNSLKFNSPVKFKTDANLNVIEAK